MNRMILLRSAEPERDRGRKFPRSPGSVRNYLRETGWIREAESDALVVPSERHFQQENLRASGGDLPRLLPQVNRYLGTDRAADRGRLFDKARAQVRPEELLQAKLYFESLESQAFKKLTLRLYNDMMIRLTTRYGRAASCPQDDASCTSYRRLLELLDKKKLYKVPGYGIPTEAEISVLNDFSSEEINKLMQTIFVREGKASGDIWTSYLESQILLNRIQDSLLSHEGEKPTQPSTKAATDSVPPSSGDTNTSHQ